MSLARAVAGGLILTREAKRPAAQPIETLPLPPRLYLSLHQHTGGAALPCVDVGQRVTIGERIANTSGAISVAVHAPADATVERIGRYPDDDSGRECIVLKVAQQQSASNWPAPDHDYHLDEPALVRQRVADAGIAGLGGAGFPTAVKLAAEVDTRLQTLLINGAECDPAIGCDDALMQNFADEIVAGARCMLHILQINQCTIAIKHDRADALQAMRTALDQARDDRLNVAPVPARYPQGGERQLIAFLSGREVPSDGLPIDVGYLCQNVATARAVHRAIEHAEPLLRRVVHVCGDGVATPRNVDVPLGARLADLIEFCGGYVGQPDQLVVGGRMMGIAAASDEQPITKTTNALLLTRATPKPPPSPCIRCGDCASVCPASLLPQQLHWHATSDQTDALVRLNLGDCIECGCCDVVCPSHIPLTAQFQQAKIALRAREVRRQEATHARRRFEARNLRRERLKREKDEQRAARREAAKAADAARKAGHSEQTDTGAAPQTRQDEIRAAVARARAARARRERDSNSDDEV
jgi:electron transport complex protein RnfC